MKQQQHISLVTYNIHKGFGVGKLRFLLPEMRNALSGINPDFVFLQEVQGLHHKRARRIGSWPALPQFEYMAEHDWPHFLYAKNAIYQSGHHGNAILSKYPFVRFENVNLSSRNRASRSILHAEVKTDTGGSLHLLCVHLGLFKAERAFQMEAMIAWIRDNVPADEPLIMAGDFNDWRRHLSSPLEEALGIQEAFHFLEGRHARSFPALKPALCVDRIYFRGIGVLDVKCFQGKPWRTLSDHLPLCARFVLD
ncbi:endonuclease/exonuclease/phosphatase family protein [Legionella sp. CNM-4043-24]|uniref:endonuclease/exonuclease/phosphatase family protein n=1 Tax=Legionella sp. CNM-4043-24 TaxID=3421646 RepID=UPI00403ABFBD